MLLVDDYTAGTGEPWSDPWTKDVVVNSGLCGRSCNSGLIRFHDSVSGPEAAELVGAAFGETGEHFHPFAVDWFGRQFGVIEPEYGTGETEEVAQLDVGAGTVVAVGSLHAVFSALADGEVEELLDEQLFAMWRNVVPGAGPLNFTECVGVKHPLFLGGELALDNFERSDISVYWHLMGHVYARTRDLPPGTQVSAEDLGLGNLGK